jgi:hypothetical protein
MVTRSFKRRTASKQAASRKVEGIEPRKCQNGKGDVIGMTEAKIDCCELASDRQLLRGLRPWHV